MTKIDLLKITDVVFKRAGYVRKGTLYWKNLKSLTILVHIQPSRWGSGFYVNIGAYPTALITKAVPPGPGTWPLNQRADELALPQNEVLRELASPTGQELPAGKITDAFVALNQWIEQHLGDELSLRVALQTKDPNAWIIQRLRGASPDDWILMDWALDRIKTPSEQ